MRRPRRRDESATGDRAGEEPDPVAFGPPGSADEATGKRVAVLGRELERASGGGEGLLRRDRTGDRELEPRERSHRRERLVPVHQRGRAVLRPDEAQRLPERDGPAQRHLAAVELAREEPAHVTAERHPRDSPEPLVDLDRDGQ